MSFGFSISDFVKLVELAFKTYERCRQSTSQFKDISAEVGHTHITLHHIHNFWRAEVERGWPLFPDEQAQLKFYSKDCRTALVKLEEILQRHSKLQKSHRVRLQFIVGDLLNDFAAVRESLRHCTANLTTFHLMLTNDVLVRRQNANEEQMLKGHQYIAQVLDGLRRTYDTDRTDVNPGPAASQVSRGDQSDRETVYHAANLELRQRGIDERAINQNQPLVREWLDTVIMPGEDEETLHEDSDLEDVVDSIGLLVLHNSLADESDNDDCGAEIQRHDPEQTRMTNSMARLLDVIMENSESWNDSNDMLLETVFNALDWQNKGYIESSDLSLECLRLMKHMKCDITPLMMTSIIDKEVSRTQVLSKTRHTPRVTKVILLDVMSHLGDLVVNTKEQEEEVELLARVRWTAMKKFSVLLNDSNASSWATATQQYLALRQSTVDLDFTVAGLISMCVDAEELLSEVRSAVTASTNLQRVTPEEIEEVLAGIDIITQMIESLQSPVKHHYLTTVAALDQHIDTYSRLPTHLAPRLQTFPFVECIQLRRDWWFRLLTLLHLLGDISGATNDPVKTWSRLGISARVERLQSSFADQDVTQALSTYSSWFSKYQLLVEQFRDVCQLEDKAFLQALQVSPQKAHRTALGNPSKDADRVRIKQLRIPPGRYCGVRIVLNGVELCQQRIDFPVGPLGTQAVTKIPESAAATLFLRPSSVLRFEFECLPKGLPQDKKVVTAHASCLKIASGRTTTSYPWEVPIHVEHGKDAQNDLIHVTFATHVDSGEESLSQQFTIGYHSLPQLKIPDGWKCMLAPFLDQDISRRVYFLNMATNRPTSIMWRLQSSINRPITPNVLDTSQLQVLTSRTDYGFMNDEDRQKTLKAYGKGDLNRNDLEYWV